MELCGSEFKVLSVNLSEKKGKKKSRDFIILIEKKGVWGDFHFCLNKQRQVSLLDKSFIDEFCERYKVFINFGDFAENITTEGIDLKRINKGDLIKISEVLLLVNGVGKICPNPCYIYKAHGDCLMQKKGIFASVLKGGKIYKGQEGIIFYKIKNAKDSY